MNYTDILKKAWNIVWKHKILWLFGLLAGSAIGSGQGFSYNFSSPNRMQQHWQNGQNFPDMFGRASGFLHSVPVFAWVLLAGAVMVAVLLFSLIAFFVGQYGTAGLIKGSALADDPQIGKLSLGEVHRALKPYYWRLVLLRLLLVFVSIMAAGLLSLPLVIFIIGTLGVGLCCLIPFFILLIPVAWAANVLVHNASIALIDENLDAIEAVKRAWQVTVRNIGPFLVLHLILMLIRFISVLVLSVPLIAAALPLLIALRASSAAWALAGGALFGLLAMVYLPLLLLVVSVLNAYDLTVRALAFRDLKDKVRVPPLGAQPLPPQETE